jgi:tocopherol cyclase
MIGKRIRSLFNPGYFQGWGKRNNYFEGWYFKFLNKAETCRFAVIPGVAMDGGRNNHAFIQVLDGKRKKSEYYKFDYGSFAASSDSFMISIGKNHFSAGGITLDLPRMKGKLFFSDNVPWPGRWYSPGIMGPYSFVPWMECYHGIVSMDNSTSGVLEYNGESIDFSGGRGYIEKDWGSSFPRGYIWVQSNHFEEPGISLKISIAKIPWLRSSFVGFIAGLWLRDTLIVFATYNGSVLKKVTADPENVGIAIENKNYRLEVRIDRDSSTCLASPVRGHMEGKIEESMSSLIHMKITRRSDGDTIFSGMGRNAAVEVAGTVEELFTG